MMSFDSLVSIAAYVITALALFWMASACGIKRPSMAFIPVVQDYTLGSIAEKGASRGHRTCKPYRKILLGLAIAEIALGLVEGILLGIFAVTFFTNMAWDISLVTDEWLAGWAESLFEDPYAIEEVMNALVGLESLLIALAVVGLALAVVAIVYAVFYYISLWHVYCLYDEKNAAIFLVVSILGGSFVPYIGGLVLPCILLYFSHWKKPCLEEDMFDEEPPAQDPQAPWTSL